MGALPQTMPVAQLPPAMTPLVYGDIENGAKTFVRIVRTKGISGARAYSQSCHAGVAAEPSWQTADQCAAFALVSTRNEGAIEHRALRSGSLRKCPDCAEMVKFEARNCRFCHAEFEPLNALSSAHQQATPRVPGHSPLCGCKRCYGKG